MLSISKPSLNLLRNSQESITFILVLLRFWCIELLVLLRFWCIEVLVSMSCVVLFLRRCGPRGIGLWRLLADSWIMACGGGGWCQIGWSRHDRLLLCLPRYNASNAHIPIDCLLISESGPAVVLRFHSLSEERSSIHNNLLKFVI